jgi:hypothetical protein
VTGPDPWPASFPVGPDGVRLAPAHRQDDTPTTSSYVHRIYGGDLDIGGLDYQACRAVLLGEIGLVDTEQRHGIGTRVLAELRADLPGYRWFITPGKGSITRWRAGPR